LGSIPFASRPRYAAGQREGDFMRTITTLALLAGALLVTACNTVHGVGQDAKSVGRVFSHDPDGNRQNR
jgi:predicted small secreted protein